LWPDSAVTEIRAGRQLSRDELPATASSAALRLPARASAEDLSWFVGDPRRIGAFDPKGGS
jgi:hypothetical protein